MRVIPIQQQKKSFDCIIFTVAYATEVFHGENVKIRHMISL